MNSHARRGKGKNWGEKKTIYMVSSHPTPIANILLVVFPPTHSVKGRIKYGDKKMMKRQLVLIFCFLISLCGYLHAEWVDADGVAQEAKYIIISPGFTNNTLIRLDSLEYPHYIWGEWNSVYYLKWNGTEWVDADGVGQESVDVVGNTQNKFYPSFQLDKDSRPNVVFTEWISGNGRLMFLKWNGAEWVDADGIGQESKMVYGGIGDSVQADIALDKFDNPIIVWTQDTYKDIFLIKWDGFSWVDIDGTGTESIDVSSSTLNNFLPCIHLDNMDNPHVAWSVNSSGNTNTCIYYLKWNGSNWTDVDGNGQESIQTSFTFVSQTARPSLDLDYNNWPMILCTSERAMYFLKWDGFEWVDADGIGKESSLVSTVNSDYKHSQSVAVDDSGRPHIMWFENTHPCYLYWNGTQWVDADGTGTESKFFYNTVYTSFTVGTRSGMVLDQCSNPHVAFFDGLTTSNNYDPVYLFWKNDTPCVPTGTVSTTATNTATQTITQNSCTLTTTVTQTESITNTFTMTQTATETVTQVLTQNFTQTVTETQIVAGTSTVTYTGTATAIETESATDVPIASDTITVTVTRTVTSAVTLTATATITLSAVVAVTESMTPSQTVIKTVTRTKTITVSPTVTMSRTLTYTRTKTPTSTFSITESLTASPTKTQTHTITATGTITITHTISPTPSITLTLTNSPTITETPSITPSVTPYPEGELYVYPNPFSIQSTAYTSLKFINLPIDAKVHIYTLSGETVGYYAPQAPIFAWNCRNMENHTVSTGIYYYIIYWDDNNKKRVGKLFLTR